MKNLGRNFDEIKQTGRVESFRQLRDAREAHA